MRVKFYGKHIEKQIANNEIIIWNNEIIPSMKLL